MATDFFSEAPYAAALVLKYMMSRCSNCFASTDSMERCGQGCNEVVYCSDSCMAADQPWHQNECIAFRNGRNQVTVSQIDLQIRLLGRLLTRRMADNGVVVLSKDFPSHLAKDRRLNDLMSHDRELKQGDYNRGVARELHGFFIKFFAGTPLKSITFDEIFHYNNVSKINGFSISWVENGEPEEFAYFGEGIYLNASRFNHSCRPTLLFSFDGNRLMVRRVNQDLLPTRRKAGDAINGTKPLTKKQFKALTFNYGFTSDCTMPVKSERLESLKSRYFFTCRCELCRDNRMTKLQMDAASVECGQCGQPYIWKRKLWNSKRTLKRTCKCLSHDDVGRLLKEDTLHHLWLLNEAWEKRCEGNAADTIGWAEECWHPEYNLRYGQLCELVMRRYHTAASNLKAAGEPWREVLRVAIEAGERMLKSYVRYARPDFLSMAFLYHRVASAHMMREGHETAKRQRAAELCKMSGEVWKQCGEPKCEKFMMNIAECLLKESGALDAANEEEE